MAAKSKAVRKSTRLKVFMTQIGLHDWVVAAASQKAALEAWDIRENLFAMGRARVVSDKDVVELAMKTPGVAVRMDAGDRLAEMGKVLRLDDHPKRRKAAKVAPEPKKAPPRAKRADRTRLDRAEQALADFRKRAVRERSALLRAQKELDLRAEALEEELDAEEERLKEAVEDAREDYEEQVS